MSTAEPLEGSTPPYVQIGFQLPTFYLRVLDGEAVLLDLASGKYLGLNAVATRACQRAVSRSTPCSMVSCSIPVSPSICRISGTTSVEALMAGL